MLTRLGVPAIGLALLVGCSTAGVRPDDDDSAEVEVSLDEVPPPVRAAILAEAGQAHVVEIEEITLASGVRNYDVEIDGDEGEFEVTFDADGSVLRREHDDDDDDHDSDDDHEDEDEGEGDDD